jgi:hypothetical protein
LVPAGLLAQSPRRERHSQALPLQRALNAMRGLPEWGGRRRTLGWPFLTLEKVLDTDIA